MATNNILYAYRYKNLSPSSLSLYLREKTKILLKALRKVRQGFKQLWGKAPKYNYKTLKKILKHCDDNDLTNLNDYRDGITLLRKLQKAREILTAAYDAETKLYATICFFCRHFNAKRCSLYWHSFTRPNVPCPKFRTCTNFHST